VNIWVEDKEERRMWVDGNVKCFELWQICIAVLTLFFAVALPILLEILRRRLRHRRNEGDNLTAIDAFIDAMEVISHKLYFFVTFIVSVRLIHRESTGNLFSFIVWHWSCGFISSLWMPIWKDWWSHFYACLFFCCIFFLRLIKQSKWECKEIISHCFFRFSNIAEGASLFFLLILSILSLRNSVLWELGKLDPVRLYVLVNDIVLIVCNSLIVGVVIMGIISCMYPFCQKKISLCYQKIRWKKHKTEGVSFDKIQ